MTYLLADHDNPNKVQRLSAVELVEAILDYIDTHGLMPVVYRLVPQDRARRSTPR